MFLWRDPFNVSACGRPSIGPTNSNVAMDVAAALNVMAPSSEFVGERVMKFNGPSHAKYSLYAIWAPLSKCRIAAV